MADSYSVLSKKKNEEEMKLTPVERSYDPGTDKDYQEALTRLRETTKAAPSYAGSYEDDLRDIYSQIVNREKFSYSPEGDALYDQYRQQYTDAGRLSMKDTMGQAAALTGGYGSSYAQSVGQQQYDAYLQKMNDIIPELYSQAYQQYSDEGQALQSRYAMLGAQRDAEYGRYRDELGQYNTDRAFAQNEADAAYERGYNNWKINYSLAADRAEQLAAQGDFTEYANLYGQEAADRARTNWMAANPELAWQNGMLTADEYRSITGKNPVGAVVYDTWQPPKGKVTLTTGEASRLAGYSTNPIAAINRMAEDGTITPQQQQVLEDIWSDKYTKA